MKQLEDGKIHMSDGNKSSLRDIERDIKKGSKCMKETGAVAVETRREVKNTNMLTKFNYSNDKLKLNRLLGAIFIKQCDEQAK